MRDRSPPLLTSNKIRLRRRRFTIIVGIFRGQLEAENLLEVFVKEMQARKLAPSQQTQEEQLVLLTQPDLD